jgi:transposase
MQISTIGLDIAKNVFQVHGIDATEKVLVRKQLRRGQVIGFSRRYRHASSGWKLALQRIIGLAS